MVRATALPRFPPCAPCPAPCALRLAPCAIRSIRGKSSPQSSPFHLCVLPVLRAASSSLVSGFRSKVQGLRSKVLSSVFFRFSVFDIRIFSPVQGPRSKVPSLSSLPSVEPPFRSFVGRPQSPVPSLWSIVQGLWSKLPRPTILRTIRLFPLPIKVKWS